MFQQNIVYIFKVSNITHVFVIDNFTTNEKDKKKLTSSWII